MSREQLIQDLFELHKSIFEFAIRNSTSRINMPLFSIQAQGHIGIDYLDIPNLNVTFELLPEGLKNQLKIALSSGNMVKKYPLDRDGLTPGLLDCFLNGFMQNYFLAVVTNPLNRYAAFLELAKKHSSEIAEWLDRGTTSKSIQVIIQPQIKMGQYTSLMDWEYKPMSLPGLCLEAYQGSQSGQEAAERVFSSSFFSRDMSTIPTTKDEILAEVDILTLALWLSLGNNYRPQDIRFERNPWRFSPDEDLPLGLKFQPLWDNSRESFLLQMYVRFNDHKLHAPDQISDIAYKRITNWISILSDNRKSIYSFNMISDGVRDVAKSLIEQSFRRDRIARDGIFRIISGLEGLNSECKPISKNGHKIDPRKTFVECWGNIWRSIMKTDTSNKYLSKSSNIDEALNQIYSLRSALAHSDPTSLPSSLQRVKNACGELFNPGQYDPGSTGVTIVMIVDEFLEYLFNNRMVLKNLINGTKPS